jgi:hypothetical protein
VSPKQLQPWAQVNHILVFKITHQVDINFPVGCHETFQCQQRSVNIHRSNQSMGYVTYTSKQRRLTTKKSFQPTIVVTYTSAFLVLNGHFVILSKAGHSTASE